MKRIIITGATSMVGVSLVEECLKNDILVTAISRKGSVNLKRLPNHKNIEIIECDLENIEDLTQICKDNYDVFYHLAWEATDKVSRYNPILQNQNVYTSLKAIEVAKKLGCHTFIGAGSQAEYGVVNEEKISPETRINPESAYGVAKYSAFKLTQIYAEQLGINHIWARIFSVYGKWDNEGTMIKMTIDKLLNKEETMFTKGEQLWDYLYSEDVGRAFYLIGLKGNDKSIYCVGSGKIRELSEYIKIIGKELGKSGDLGIGKIEYDKNQVMKLCADITKLTEDTGFIPRFDFEEGIKRTIDWQKSFLEERNNVKRKN